MTNCKPRLTLLSSSRLFHRALALEAAEQGGSLNRLASAKLAT